MCRWRDSFVLKTEFYFRPKHRNIFTTRCVNPKEDRQVIDSRPDNLKNSVDCVDSEDGNEKLRRNNCSKLPTGRA